MKASRLITAIFFCLGFYSVIGNRNNSIEITYPEPEPLLDTLTITVYNPVPEQCDSDPLITASGRKIDTTALKRGDLRLCAISRDLLGKYTFGDTICVRTYGDCDLQGIYIIEDVINRRYTKSIDLLTYNRKAGKWKGFIASD